MKVIAPFLFISPALLLCLCRRAGWWLRFVSPTSLDVARRCPFAHLLRVSLVKVVHDRVQLLYRRQTLIHQRPGAGRRTAARLRAQILVVRRAVERRDVIAQMLDEIRVMPQLDEGRLQRRRRVRKRRRVCHQCRVIVVGRQAKLLQNLRRVLRRRNRTGRLVDAPQFRHQQFPLDALARDAFMEIARAARLITRRLRQACDHPGHRGERRLRLRRHRRRCCRDVRCVLCSEPVDPRQHVQPNYIFMFHSFIFVNVVIS